jgi:hypothetical protein
VRVWTIGLGILFWRTAARLKRWYGYKEQAYSLFFYLIAAKFEKAINENVKVKKSKSI